MNKRKKEITRKKGAIIRWTEAREEKAQLEADVLLQVSTTISSLQANAADASP